MSTQEQLIVERYPVSATYHGAEGWTTPGLSYSDFERMQTHTHVLAPGRRFATPSWAVNDAELSELVTLAIEKRAHFRDIQPGSIPERITRAEAVLRKQRPEVFASLQRLCTEYVQLKKQPQPDAERVRVLEILIPNRDTMLRMIDGGAARILLGVVYHFYRRGLHSLQVAEELGLKHCHVRQILWRLHEDWRDLKGIEPERIRPLHGPFKGQPYVVDEMEIEILNLRGLTLAAISQRLRVPYFEVGNAMKRIKTRRKREAETCETVHEYTGETVPINPVPRRFDHAPATPQQNIRYKLYADYCKRIGQSPMSEKVWCIQDRGGKW